MKNLNLEWKYCSHDRCSLINCILHLFLCWCHTRFYCCSEGSELDCEAQLWGFPCPGQAPSSLHLWPTLFPAAWAASIGQSDWSVRGKHWKHSSTLSLWKLFCPQPWMLQFVVKNTLRNLRSLSSQMYLLSVLATGKILSRDVILTIVLSVDLIQLCLLPLWTIHI